MVLCLQRDPRVPCLLGLGCGEKPGVTWFDMDWSLLVTPWRCTDGMLGRHHTSCPSAFCPSTFWPEFGKFKALEWVPSLAGGPGRFWWHPGLCHYWQWDRNIPLPNNPFPCPWHPARMSPALCIKVLCLAFAILPLLSGYFGKSKVLFHGL